MSADILPTHAGPVRLIFDPTAGTARLRDSATIVLPLPTKSTRDRQVGNRLRFHPLMSGRQFLARISDDCRCHHYNVFGGCDEQIAFLTGVTDFAYAAFAFGDERRFYEALCPPTIKAVAARHPGTRVIRQGDIWAAALPYDWEELGKDLSLFHKRTRQRMNEMRRADSWKEASSMKIFSTRHSLTGRTFLYARIKSSSSTGC